MLMKSLFILLMLSFTTPPVPVEIAPEEARKHVGEKVKVCGKISEARFFESASKQTIISMGGTSPSLNIVISFEDRKKFTYKPEEFLKNKSVCISGKVVDNNGKAEL